MKELLLDGKAIHCKADLFESLSSQFAHPEFTPKNLDACNDLLGEMKGQDIRLKILHPELLRQTLGNHYYYKFLQVFENHHCNILLQKL